MMSGLRIHRAVAGGVLFLLLGAGPAGLSAQVVQGRVLDADTDRPVGSAVVELLGAQDDAGALTAVAADEAGRFLLRAPATGTYRIRAGQIGYRTVTTSAFDLASGADPLDVEVLLGVEAIPLAPLVIVSERPARMDLRLHIRGFYQRRSEWGREGMGFGHFLEREDIERRNPSQVVDLLRDIPGVRIESRGGRRPGEITLRAVTSIMDMGLRCSPLIYLDGVLAATGAPEVVIPGVNAGAHIDDLVSVVDIAGVEVYPGLTQPGQFLRGNLCGSIVIWTGGGGRAPRARSRPAFGDGEGTFAVEFRLGSGIGDFAPTASGLHWAPALAGGVLVEGRVVSRVSLYAGASRNAFRCDRGECKELDASFVSRGWDAGLRGDLDMVGRPWVRLGLVLHELEARWVEDGGERGRTSSPKGFGIDAGVGFEIPIVRGVSLTPGVRYLRWSVSYAGGGRFVDPFTIEDPLRVVVLGAGVRARF